MKNDDGTSLYDSTTTGMPIATAPALLIGIGARIVLDQFSRSDGPSVKGFILIGAWQGVALHYATKMSGTSGFGIIVAFAIAAKLFIEFNLVSDITRCVSTILGVALGVLFTDFLSQYFDRPPQPPSDRRRKKTHTNTTPVKPEKKRERLVQFRPSVQGGSVETPEDVTDFGTLATTSHHISDITSVDSQSDRLGPTSSMTPLEREIHVLRTRASLADSERRRLKEERKWAISAGNIARASQMKWEVKRYTALMQTFNREADLKALEGEYLPTIYMFLSDGNTVVANGVTGTRNDTNHRDELKPTSTTSKDRSPKSYRDSPVNGNGSAPNGRTSQRLGHHRRPSAAKHGSPRDANG